jgi:hypothetical protein
MMDTVTNELGKESVKVAEQELRWLKSVRSGVASHDKNVGDLERIGSAAAGATLVALGLRQKSIGGLLLALAGGALVYRGAKGYCNLYSALGLNTARPSAYKPKERLARPSPSRDAVEEALLESFPASDPPAMKSATA